MVGKLNLKDIRCQCLDHSANLSSIKTSLGHVFGQSHYIQNFHLFAHPSPNDANNSSAPENPLRGERSIH